MQNCAEPNLNEKIFRNIFINLIMNEIFFLIEEALEGGYTAKAIGESIFTEGDTMEDLKENIREAVQCHFDEGKLPKIIRLHMVKEEIITV
jgi:predicted RNase H-like HicB family nuclease